MMVENGALPEETQEGDELTPAQYAALEALLTSGKVTEAARAAGVHRNSIYRWLKQEPFKRALVEGEARALESLSRAIVHLGDKAVQVLQAAMEGRKTPVAVKVRAANYVLGRLLQLHELVELQEQLNEQAAQIQALQEQVERGRRS